MKKLSNRYVTALLVISLLANVACYRKIKALQFKNQNNIAKIDELGAMLSESSMEMQELYDTIEMYKFELSKESTPNEEQEDMSYQYYDVALSHDLQEYIWSLCNEYGIVEHYPLIFAVIKTESNFKANTVSSTNDYGLMQINKINHKHLSKTLGIVDFLDPYQNVHCGVYMLSKLLAKYDVADALMAYNMGEGGAAKLWKRGIHTTSYTDKVLNNLKEYI